MDPVFYRFYSFLPFSFFAELSIQHLNTRPEGPPSCKVYFQPYSNTSTWSNPEDDLVHVCLRHCVFVLKFLTFPFWLRGSMVRLSVLMSVILPSWNPSVGWGAHTGFPSSISLLNTKTIIIYLQKKGGQWKQNLEKNLWLYNILMTLSIILYFIRNICTIMNVIFEECINKYNQPMAWQRSNAKNHQAGASVHIHFISVFSSTFSGARWVGLIL